jgi:hypothetical protein
MTAAGLRRAAATSARRFARVAIAGRTKDRKLSLDLFALTMRTDSALPAGQKNLLEIAGASPAGVFVDRHRFFPP